MYGRNYIIYNPTIIDGTGKYPIEDKAVVISCNKIKAIINKNNTSTYTDYKIIDATNMFLMPGLIDSHIHFSGLVGDRISAYTLDPNIRMLRSLHQAQATLSYGITSVRDISWQGLFLKRMFHNDELLGPRIVSCGPGLTRTGGHGEVAELPLDYVASRNSGAMGDIADTPDEIIKTIRYHLRSGADQIKFWATGGGYSTVDKDTDCHYSREEIKIIVNEGKKIAGVKTCAHAETLTSIKDCVDAGVDTIEHGEDLDEETAIKMRDKNIILVPTLKLVANWFFDRYGEESPSDPVAIKYGPFMAKDVINPPEVDAHTVRKQAYDSFDLARGNGVKIALGSDCVFDTYSKYGDFSIRELMTLSDAGMTPLEALKAGTLNSAEALGLHEYIGTVEEGKIADLLLLENDPLTSFEILLDKSNIKYVIQNGKIVAENGIILC